MHPPIAPSTMMRFIFVSGVLLAQAFIVHSQHAPSDQALICEDRARKAGMPTILGWKAVLNNVGQLNCCLEDIPEICHGVEYIDTDTKAVGCCQDSSDLTWINMPDKLAKCCARGHVWSYDKGINPMHGGCCPAGSIMQNGPIVPPHVPIVPHGPGPVVPPHVPIVPPHRPAPHVPLPAHGPSCSVHGPSCPGRGPSCAVHGPPGGCLVHGPGCSGHGPGCSSHGSAPGHGPAPPHPVPFMVLLAAA
ncbi:hypothetical protein K503DRAFT_296470 [Rhizopogon vinicolor AM-OR11-026]|uniref:Hydrophobin n=1 Tax=Rhizopogon vinicolor AM-OR11-026 TaxID=1314800 RepID=A0A1B7MV74_9AGAM|nr:hypothetical protein K503DRAFT_296470 [Rhizopogon vinicolor AM-OR11-026]